MLLTADLHTHPLGDRYCRRPVKKLTVEDRKDITAYMHHLITRGIQVAALTDHDMLAGGLLARDMALSLNLPIIIVPGTELSVLGKTQRLHLLALNVSADLPSSKMTLREAVREVHAQGGIAVLAHPVRYPHEIRLDPEMLDYLDGLETVNSAEGVFDTRRLLNENSCYGRRLILQTAGSDEHWERGRTAHGPAPAARGFEMPAAWLVENGIVTPRAVNELLKKQ